MTLAHLERARSGPRRRNIWSVRNETSVPALVAGTLHLEWTGAQVLYDDPAKTLDPRHRQRPAAAGQPAAHDRRPTGALRPRLALFRAPARKARRPAALARSGVQVRVLTNSLAASGRRRGPRGYARSGAPLLRAAACSFEFKPTAAADAARDMPPKPRRQLDRGPARQDLCRRRRAPVRRLVQLRSAFGAPQHGDGAAAREPRLAGELARAFDTDIRYGAYEVVLDTPGDGLVWIDRSRTGEEHRHATDPDTSWWLRSGVTVLSVLPIDWLL